MTSFKTDTSYTTYCYHCGSECDAHSSIHYSDKIFCCNGCKSVYEILEEKQMCQYYAIDQNAGIKVESNARFEYLDEDSIANQFIEYSDHNFTQVTFYVPTIHCTSCLWLLENLFKINENIIESRVNFLEKKVSIKYKTGQIKLSEIAQLLTRLGYEPLISMNDVVKSDKKKYSSDLIYKIAVAGFCFGNIMMFSFPEYFGIDSSSASLANFFIWANLILSLPVVFYSGSIYFTSVYHSLKQGHLNLDTPILLGILATFIRSIVEVFSSTGVGYFDSLTGLIFFLLIGKWFQQRTFDYISFERDFKSYFPLAITNIGKDGELKAKPVSDLKVGDKIMVKNQEIIPCDSILYEGTAMIDYSFVTGESEPIQKKEGEILYAGGKQVGQSIKLEVIKEISQNYLTQLWNNKAFEKANKKKSYRSFTDKVGKNFTISILLLTLATCTYWYVVDSSLVWNVFTAMLIIACPCTLALSYPVALNNIIRLLGRNEIYVKNIDVIENITHIDTIVFDKTGTLTKPMSQHTDFVGLPLSNIEKQIIFSLASQSIHPLSVNIANYIGQNSPLELNNFKENVGYGIEAEILNIIVKLGSLEYVTNDENKKYFEKHPYNSTNRVYVSFNNELRGYFNIQSVIEPSTLNTLCNIAKSKSIAIVSGDNNRDEELLKKNIQEDGVHMIFGQNPQQKLDYVAGLQSKNKQVMMVGDGLNDAGALKQAEVGVAITHNQMNFTPSSDIIMKANMFEYIPNIFAVSKWAMYVVYLSFAVSLIYNAIGLYFAMQGKLEPVIAAILMPLNSISVVLISFWGTSMAFKKIFFSKKY